MHSESHLVGSEYDLVTINGLSTQMEGDKYSCVCPEGFIGEKCSTWNTTISSTNTTNINTNTSSTNTTDTNTSSTRTLTPPTTPGPVPGPRSQEGSSTMPVAAVAGIVAGVLLAVLLCGVLVVVMVYIQCRRRRHFHSEQMHVYNTSCYYADTQMVGI